jgi:hypothetical protein
MTHPFETPPAVRDSWGAWDRFLVGHRDTGFRQSSWWAASHRAAGGDAFAVMAKRDGIIHGGGVVLRERWSPTAAYYRVGDGPVLPDDPGLAETVIRTLLTSVQRRRALEPFVISHLRLEPRWPELPTYLRDLRPVEVGRPRTAATIDLTVSETEILAQMAPATRAQIALARQLGLTISEDSTDHGIADLVRLAGRSGVRSTGLRSPDTVRLLPLLHLPGRGGIFFAEDAGTRLAGAAVLTFGARATLLVACAVDAARQSLAPALLQFEVMRRMRGRHCALYDLGEFATRGPLFEGLGGERTERVPTLDLVLDAAAYAAVAGGPGTDPVRVVGTAVPDVT